ncbi:hypothetical protein [Streptomyces ipomoeae]|uniref:hypothetical protein n=1 Tax=Streptomyces ipomoeae TaxID=103232 RepID=UPI0011468D15|nr:hypothetical protein [Streptomyces ipomoeae]MDX2939303.1 hypothetical protein [Streptomyces ipomoeae]TQE22512.1 hypothetical protein SipoB123_23420 [Streptomyces ipomoeae]
MERYDDFGEDEDTGRMKVTVRVPLGTRLALTSGLERHQAWTQQLKAHHRAQLKGLTPAQKDALRAEQRQTLDALRSRGSLLDKRDLLIAFGLRQELQARGWDRSRAGAEWEEIPMGFFPAALVSSYPESLSLFLPASVVEQVRAGCWSSSRDAIRRLQKWRADYSAAVLQSREGPPEAEYRRLAAGVTTTGEVYRAGVRRGLHAVLHAPTPPPIRALAPR